ncbi:MAG: hypothetical protein KDA44_13265 [Planctomycetales bacterium]|nr:hypothetical protein [Planctomycetales bacterium]
MNRTTLGLVFIWALGAASPAGGATITGRMNFPGKVPPVKYLTPAEIAAVKAGALANPNPPVNFDVDGNKQNDSWTYDSLLQLPRVPGSPKVESIPKTDEPMANFASVFVIGVADPAGSGFGLDHWSGRYVRMNDRTPGGAEVGACVYTRGINSWFLYFNDDNNNKVADRFLKSVWRCRNGETQGPQAGERTYFVTDLTKNKVAAEKVVRRRGQPGVDKISYSITDMSIFSFGPDLSTASLGGKPIELPQPLPDGTTEDLYQSFEDQLPLEVNQLTGLDDLLLLGRTYSLLGEIQNTDDVSHEYSLTHFGVNATVLSMPAPMFIAPGQSAFYELQFLVTGSGEVGIASLAYADDGAESDGWLDAAIMAAVP